MLPKALPEAEFLESCRRFRQQVSDERGEVSGWDLMDPTVSRLTIHMEDEMVFMTDQQRLQVFDFIRGKWCLHCGTEQPTNGRSCQCTNYE